jgi:hypothetical protein
MKGNPMKTINSKGISTVAIVGIVVIVLLAGGLVWWQVGKGDNGNSNSNTNILTNTNNTNTATNKNLTQNTNTSVTVDPVTGWNVYTNEELGITFNYPDDWIAKQTSVTEGTFNMSLIKNVNESSNQTVIMPKVNQIDYSPAAQCYLTSYNSNSTIDNWIDLHDVYNDSGLTIIEKKIKNIHQISGTLIDEGGGGPQLTKSYYFISKGKIIRFGYYQDIGTQPYEMFVKYSAVCEKILESLDTL